MASSKAANRVARAANKEDNRPACRGKGWRRSRVVDSLKTGRVGKRAACPGRRSYRFRVAVNRSASRAGGRAQDSVVDSRVVSKVGNRADSRVDNKGNKDSSRSILCGWTQKMILTSKKEILNRQ